MRIEHQLAVLSNAALSAAGLCYLSGIFAAMGSASPVVLSLLIFMMIVAGGAVFGFETVKARLLEFSSEALGMWRWIGRAGWAFFVALSISLSHVGLVAAEHAILSPVTAPLEQAVANARADLEAARSALEARRSDAERRSAQVSAEIASTPESYAMERERLRQRRDAIESSLASDIETLEESFAISSRELSRATSELEAAPEGFLSLSVDLFGVQIAVAAWLIPIALEYITGLYGRLSMPTGSARRSVEHGDVLALDPAGIELLTDADYVRRLGSKHASLAAKCSHHARSIEKLQEKLHAS
jgi:hypothetical protein